MTVRISYYTDPGDVGVDIFSVRRNSQVFEEDTINFDTHFIIRAKLGEYWIEPAGLLDSIFIDGRLLMEPTKITNGTEFNCGDRIYKFNIEFQAVPYSKSSALFTKVTALLVGVILLVECLLVFWLPYQMNNNIDQLKNGSQHRCDMKMDELRVRLSNITAKVVDEDEKARFMATQAFLKKELERITSYLRANRGLLQQDALKSMVATLMRYEAIIRDLEQKTAWQGEEQFLTDPWIDKHCQNN